MSFAPLKLPTRSFQESETTSKAPDSKKFTWHTFYGKYDDGIIDTSI